MIPLSYYLIGFPRGYSIWKPIYILFLHSNIMSAPYVVSYAYKAFAIDRSFSSPKDAVKPVVITFLPSMDFSKNHVFQNS